MNKIRASKYVELSSITLAILTIAVVVAVSNASAVEQKPRGSGAGSQVVAHISFAGLSAIDMAMQKKMNDKYCLDVQLSADQGISIIDISKPAHPKAVGVIPCPDPSVSSRMNRRLVISGGAGHRGGLPMTTSAKMLEEVA